MTRDWTWEHMPDAAEVVGGPSSGQKAEIEALAERIADAVGVRRIGRPFDVTESVSDVQVHTEGHLAVWYLEDYRDNVVLVVRVQHLLA